MRGLSALFVQETPERINHDRLFKELIRSFFEEFIVAFFPDVYEYIDFHEISFLKDRKDKILSKPVAISRSWKAYSGRAMAPHAARSTSRNPLVVDLKTKAAALHIASKKRRHPPFFLIGRSVF